MRKIQTRQSTDLVEHTELPPSQRKSRATSKSSNTSSGVLPTPNSPPAFSICTNPLFANSSAQIPIPNPPVNHPVNPLVNPIPPRVQHFVPFSQGNPVNLTQHDDIPIASLKSLPFFTRGFHHTH